MPPNLRSSTKNSTKYNKIYDAITNTKPVKITYNNKTRIVYPLKMGSKRVFKHKNILCLEKKEPKTLWQSIIGFISPDYRWKVFTLNKITNLKILDQDHIN